MFIPVDEIANGGWSTISASSAVNAVEQGGGKLHAGAVAALGTNHYFLLWDATLSINLNLNLNHKSSTSNNNEMRCLLEQLSVVLK